MSGDRKHALDPIDAISEVLFGLIMVLTITGSLSIASVGGAEVRSLLIGALGGNLAWGIIDGVFYLIASLARKSTNQRALHAVRAAATPAAGQRVVVDALPDEVAAVLRPADLEMIRERLVRRPEPPRHPRLEKADWLGALWVCLLVLMSSFPVVIPFLFMHDGRQALRASSAIAILMMFFTGFAHGRRIGQHPWLMGFAMVLLGFALVGLTIALGG